MIVQFGFFYHEWFAKSLERNAKVLLVKGNMETAEHGRERKQRHPVTISKPKEHSNDNY